MRKQLLAMAVATAATASLVIAHQPVSAASAHDCAGAHTWIMPNNSTNFVYSGTVQDGWDRTCANVDTSGAPFGAVTVNHDVSYPNYALSSFAGNCALGFTSTLDNGVRYFIGGVAVAVGAQGTATQTSVGVLGVPSVTPCSGGTITWSGVENFSATP